MDTVTHRVLALINHVEHYDIELALEEFYQEDYKAYENTDAVRIGIAATLKRIRRERAQMDTLYYLKCKNWMRRGTKSMIQWAWEFKDQEGRIWYAEEVNIAIWKDGKIKEEQYVYHFPVPLAEPSQSDFIYKNKNVEGYSSC